MSREERKLARAKNEKCKHGDFLRVLGVWATNEIHGTIIIAPIFMRAIALSLIGRNYIGDCLAVSSLHAQHSG